MKIVLVSGFLNNHLLPICEIFTRNCNFIFIATENRKDKFLENRASIERPYVIHDYIKNEEQKCLDAVVNADVAIFGGSSSKFLEIRKSLNKLSYIYSERVFKRGQYRRFYPPTRKILKKYFINNNNNVYTLCASSYLAADIKLLGFQADKCFKFGYFPLIHKFNIEDLLNRKFNDSDKRLKLLYVGRLLRWKKVDTLIHMCRILEDRNIDYDLNIVGEGVERPKLEEVTTKLKLKNVYFRGNKSIDYVAKLMKDSHILYLPSSKYEGWGAVVNEALGYGCVVIESDAAGSARYLINDGVNGYIVHDNSPEGYLDCTMKYLKADNKMDLHIAAYNTIWNKWNAEVAVNRFIEVSNSILNGAQYVEFADGPMSKDSK